MSSAPGPLLDHLILLVPSLAPSDTAFLSDNGFELHPGGQHADGLTENTLVLLQDGVYLEIIAFTSQTTDAARSKHWWGNKSSGWIDWSLAPTPLEAAARVHALNYLTPPPASAGESNKVFTEPVEGGRETKDGKQLKWKVAFPVLKDEEKRGVIPFFCEDVTDRTWRVPTRSTPHPNSTTGIKSLTVLSKPDGAKAYTDRLSYILSSSLALKTPFGDIKVPVHIREPSTEEEKAWVEERGEGLYEVELNRGDGESVRFGAQNGARFA
ncbi:hypothetical protein T439DRAFT_311347 [Meredithblackwellia eburnea MCA 4105]